MCPDVATPNEPEKLRVAHYLAEFPSLTQAWIPPLLELAQDSRPEVWAIRTSEGKEHGDVPVRAIGMDGKGMGRWLGRALARLSGFELREELRLWQALGRGALPDVVHAHFGPQGYAAARPCRRRRIPLVTSFYGYDLGLARDPCWSRRYRTLWRAGSAFLVEGTHMQNCVRALGAPEEKVHVLPLAVPVDEIEFRPRRRRPGQPVRILQVARLVEKKGVDVSICAVAQLSREGHAITLRVVGDGPLRQQLEELTARESATPLVKFVGWVDHDGMLDELARADLVIQPSRAAADGDTEGGAPYVLLEAQAAGLCIVASDHADIPNVVAPEAYFAAPEGDLKGTISALRAAVTADSEWCARAEFGRRFVAERHAARHVVGRLEGLYRLLAPSPSRSHGWRREGRPV